MNSFPCNKKTRKVHIVKVECCRRGDYMNYNRIHVNFNFVIIDGDAKVREMILCGEKRGLKSFAIYVWH